MTCCGDIQGLSPIIIYNEASECHPNLKLYQQKIKCHKRWCHENYRCCVDIQGPSRIMILMMDSDRHYFLGTKISCDGPFMVAAVDAHIW